MSTRRPSLLVLGFGVASVMLWVGIAAANGVGSLGREGRTRLPDFKIEMTPPQNKLNEPSIPAVEQAPRDISQGPAWLWYSLQALVALAVAYGLYRLVRRILEEFVLVTPPQTSAEVVEDDTPEVDLEQMADDLRTSLAELRASDDFRGAIVACWRRLEDLAAGSGTARSPWQSTREFSVDVLQHTPADRTDLAELADIYRRACYAAGEPSEADRAEAEACLERLTTAFEVSRA